MRVLRDGQGQVNASRRASRGRSDASSRGRAGRRVDSDGSDGFHECASSSTDRRAASRPSVVVSSRSFVAGRSDRGRLDLCVSRVFHAEDALDDVDVLLHGVLLGGALVDFPTRPTWPYRRLRSNMPGRAGMRKGGGSEGWRTIWENVQGADKGKIGSATHRC